MCCNIHGFIHRAETKYNLPSCTMSNISALRAADDYKRTLAKVINKGPDGTAFKQAYDNCTWFTLRQPEINGINELSL